MKLVSTIYLFFLVLMSQSAWGNVTFDWRNNQLNQLQKITVGPWDNFGTTLMSSKILSEKHRKIIYTQDKNQILSLFQLNVDTGESEKFEFTSADVKQPALNESGKILAFTYFGDDAQGDICLYRIEGNKINDANAMTCFDVAGAAQSAFWLGENRLGYLKREPNGFNWQLVVRDLVMQNLSLQKIVTSAPKERVVAQGEISAPTASHDGRYILFNDKSSHSDESQILRLYDVETSTETIMPNLSLPGNIGFSAFSVDNDFIYFSYYLNDTNNDQRIDADDNSVIFRLPFKAWKSSTEKLLPEQLTSVEYNCKFPRPGREYLYLTCAFGGSLDVYRLPLTGMVKPSWNTKQLNEAHAVSRSYERRLLLLNAMRYRNMDNSAYMLERIIGNHLQLGEITATRYYINQLLSLDSSLSRGNKNNARFYVMLNDLLVLRSEKRKYKNNVITLAFRRLAKKIKSNIATNDYSTTNNTRLLAMAFIENELGNRDDALLYLNKVNLNSYLSEVEKYLAISLYEDVLSGADLLPYYFILLNDVNTSFDFRLFYAFKYLSLDGRYDVDAIKDEAIKSLFFVDRYVKNIVNESDEKNKIALYKKLSKHIKAERGNKALMRAMHLHAIDMLAENNEIKYMELFSRHWLTLTKINEMDFVNVAKQYTYVNKNKAYGFMRNDQPEKAFNSFYPVMRQANDLEAYYQYLTLGNNVGTKLRLNTEKSLAVLKKQKLLGENKKYTDALTLLLNAGVLGGDKFSVSKNTKILDDALIILQKRDVNTFPDSMNELLLGFIYHKKMELTQQGYVYDKLAYQQAHYHYMMALDLARDNHRISATVLQNLGWLHQSVAQYALAVTYFQQRDAYPFLNKASELSYRWVLAKSFYYNNQPNAAYKQTALILSKSLAEKELPYKEKMAFYAMQAGDYVVAVKLYESIFSSSVEINNVNFNKMKLAYGFSLSKVGKKYYEVAIIQLEESLFVADKLKKLPKNNQRLIAFNPLKQKLIAHGLIAKLSHVSSVKESHLKSRIDILIALEGGADIGFDEMSRLSFLAKDYQALALLYEREADVEKMNRVINHSLDAAIDWMVDSDDDVGPVIYRTLINYLSLGITHADIFRRNPHKLLEKTYSTVSDTLKEYPYPSPSVIYQYAKLNILWLAFNNDAKGIDALMQEDKIVSLAKTSSEKHNELTVLVNYFKP